MKGGIYMEQVNSIDKFLSVLGKYRNGSEEYYRGQSEEFTDITPSISRNEEYFANESKIYQEAIILGSVDLVGLNSPLEKLSKLQHYGIPTRLIDVTIDPLMALYFAVEKDTDPYPGNVYVFQEKSYTIDSKRIKILSILPTLDNRTIENIRSEYKTQFGDDIDNISDDDILSAVNLPVILSYSDILQKSNPRLYNQKGTFLICGNKVNNGKITDKLRMFETYSPVVVVRIPFEYKKSIKRELDNKYNINVTSVYPELPSVAGYIKNKYTKMKDDDSLEYSIVKEENVSTGVARRISVIIVLEKKLTIEKIKSAAIALMQKYQKTQDVIWIYVALTGDDYITCNWILRGQWINPKLNPTFRPFTLKNEENGFYWDYNDSYSVTADLYKKYSFEDNSVLYMKYTKAWEQFILSYNRINDSFFTSNWNTFVERVHAETKTVRNLYMQLSDFGHSHNKDFDDFLRKIDLTICTLDNICQDVKMNQNPATYHWISKQLRSISTQIEKNSQGFIKWKADLGSELD